ncbi:twin-arginine translocation signal domain-containing protein [Luteimonas salinilitoris]|uniref:Twin-arginine translocation signal domain-containing protein n=1 Tax=Luteimonas salinilitoris TaxID=3237697 RepID=A0ABV4HK15_9GAMM
MTPPNDDHRPGAGPAVSRRTFLQGSAAAAAGIALGANAAAAETAPGVAAPRPRPRWRAQPFAADRVRVSDPRPSFNRLTGTQLPSVFFEPDESWVRRSGEGGQVFEATGIDGPLQLVPLHRIRDERYAIYCRARPAWERKPQF